MSEPRQSRHGVVYDAAMLGTEIPLPEGSRWQAWRARSEHPATPTGLVEVWLSRVYIAQVFLHPAEAGWRRLTVRRIDGREIRERWDELQAIKNEVVGEHTTAIEAYPDSREFVNVANMRHLFIVPRGFTIPCIWTREKVVAAGAKKAAVVKAAGGSRDQL